MGGRNDKHITLLDLSAAFDTIDHDILLKRLNVSFGISETALQWFCSYLSNRRQTVVVGEHKSAPTILQFGVPQGSVLGPVLFSLYAQSLCTILKTYEFDYHLYADDSQLYKSFDLCGINSVLDKLANCLVNISKWMASNKLKLN